MPDPTRPGHDGPARSHPSAAVVLVLGIVGVLVPLVSFAAWFVGNRALVDVRQHPGLYVDADQIRVGRMLGKVVSILTLLAALGLAAVVAYYVLPAPDR